MTHIAFVHIEFPSGGGERITMDIARYLMRTYPGSYRISILTFSFREDLLPEEFKDSIRVHTVPDPDKVGQATFTEKAIGIVRAEKIDILVQVGQIYLSLKDISRTTGCRTVFANHGRPLWEADFSMWERQQIAKRKLRRTILWFGLRKWIYLISGKTYRKVLGTYRRNYEESDAYVVLCGEYREKLVSALGCDPGRNKIAVIENPEYKVAVDAIHASNPNVQEPFDIINWEIDSIIMNHMLAFANGTETLDQCHDGIVNECNQKLADYHRANG